MQQPNPCMTTVFILASISLSGTALGQSSLEPPRKLLRIAEQAADMDMKLAGAIALAEKHTGGTAIGVHLTMDRQLFMTSANGVHELWTAPDGEAHPARKLERTVPAKKAGEGKAANPADTESRQSEQRISSGSAPTVFAIVTCVLDNTAVRDVVIDMADATVLGVQSTYSTDKNAREVRRVAASPDASRYSLVRATDMMNASARNATNQHVGDIDDLVLDPESNHVVYGVLRRGGFMGFNEARYAVPARMLNAPEDGRILLNLSNDDFEGRSGFDNDKWPLQADSAWVVRGAGAQETTKRRSRILRATELIGTNVQSDDGQKVGEISDLVVEPSSGQVIYAIIETGRGRLVVPMSVVQQMGTGRIMRMSHAEVTTLPTLGDDTEPDWGNRQWNQAVHERYDTDVTLAEVPS